LPPHGKEFRNIEVLLSQKAQKANPVSPLFCVQKHGIFLSKFPQTPFVGGEGRVSLMWQNGFH
jgi:hypothetical protein